MLKLNHLSVAGLDGLGNIYYDQEKIDKAIEYYKRAIAINPNFAPVYNDLGNAYHSQGKIEEAIAEYKKALSLDVNFNLARQNLLLAMESIIKANREQNPEPKIGETILPEPPLKPAPTEAGEYKKR